MGTTGGTARPGYATCNVQEFKESFFIFLRYLIVPQDRRERYKYFTFILHGFSHIFSRFCCIPSGAEGKDFIAGKKLEEKREG